MDSKFPPPNISSSHHTGRMAVTPPDDSDTPDQPLVAGASTASLTPHIDSQAHLSMSEESQADSVQAMNSKKK